MSEQIDKKTVFELLDRIDAAVEALDLDPKTHFKVCRIVSDYYHEGKTAGVSDAFAETLKVLTGVA